MILMVLKTLEERKIRIETVKNMIKDQKEIEFNKFIAIISMNTGVSRNTAKEYIQILNDFGFLEIRNNIILFKGV